jgi:hypothetical protein
MSQKTLNFSLDLDVFSFEFAVDAELSAELTHRFNEHDSEFLFAAGEIWIRTPTCRELILPVTRPQNILQLLGNIAKALGNPPSAVGLEKLIAKGGWSSWMSGYDQRLYSDSTSSQDELTCDVLLPFSVVEGSRGRIIIYSYVGCPIVEVVAHSEGDKIGCVFWGQYDPAAVVHRLRHIKTAMREAVAAAVREVG